MIPELNENGELPEGIFSTTPKEIEERFGSQNTRRRQLMRGLRRAMVNLKSAGVRHLYIDGSFTTHKGEPQDIDGCWDPHPDMDLEKLDPVFLNFAQHRRLMKRKYGVDFFISTGIESGSGRPFVDFFQTNRDGEQKGILKITL